MHCPIPYLNAIGTVLSDNSLRLVVRKTVPADTYYLQIRQIQPSFIIRQIYQSSVFNLISTQCDQYTVDVLPAVIAVEVHRREAEDTGNGFSIVIESIM